MSQRAATITSLPMAFEVVKAMQAQGLEWSEGYRPLGRQALEEIIEGQMAAAVDRYFDQLEAEDRADRRSGACASRFLCLCTVHLCTGTPSQTAAIALSSPDAPSTMRNSGRCRPRRMRSSRTVRQALGTLAAHARRELIMPGV